MTTLDSHVHFWQYNKLRDSWMDDMKILQQDYLPEFLAQTLHRNGIEGVIAVQADQSEVETRFLVELSKTHSIIKGVVGWLDLLSPKLEQKLEEFSAFPVIKGWRHIAQTEPDNFLAREDFQKGVAHLAKYNYTYDILIYPKQLPAALNFVEKLQSQKLIIDHCAKPDVRRKKIEDWEKYMREIAKYPNVYCKLSGLLTEASWKDWAASDFYPYLDVVFEAFGTDRIVFGSDWPVMLVSGIYVQWKSLIEKYMQDYSAEEKENVFGLNGMRFYGIE